MDAMECPKVRQGVSRDTLSIPEGRSTAQLQRIHLAPDQLGCDFTKSLNPPPAERRSKAKFRPSA
jgi:hypothetical protein